MKRILAIDGGGIRGIIAATFLVEIERLAGVPLAQVFDLIAGTSTGGIIASGLGIGMTAQSLLDLYIQRGGEIFADSLWRDIKTLDGTAGARYSPANLDAILKQTLGDKTLNDCLTKVMCPTYAFEMPQAGGGGLPGTYFWKSWTGPNAYLRDVARCTSAAETYFPQYRFTLLNGTEGFFADGGTFAGSPGVCARTEAQRLWPGEECLVVAIGTGTNVTPLPYADYKDAGLIDIALVIPGIFLDGSCDITDYALRYYPGTDYRRFDVPETASPDVADASPSNIAALQANGAAGIAMHRALLDALSLK